MGLLHLRMKSVARCVAPPNKTHAISLHTSPHPSVRSYPTTLTVLVIPSPLVRMATPRRPPPPTPPQLQLQMQLQLRPAPLHPPARRPTARLLRPRHRPRSSLRAISNRWSVISLVPTTWMIYPKRLLTSAPPNLAAEEMKRHTTSLAMNRTLYNILPLQTYIFI